MNASTPSPPSRLGESHDVTANPPTYMLAFGIFMLGVGVIGVFGNITSIFLFSRRGMRSPLTILLMGLSLADLMLILLCLLTFAVPNLTVWIQKGRAALIVDSFIIYTAVSSYPTTHIFQSVSLWLLVVITVERFIVIANPFSTHRLTVRRASISVAIVVFLAIVYNLVRFWEWGITWAPIITNATLTHSDEYTGFHSGEVEHGTHEHAAAGSNLDQVNISTTKFPMPMAYQKLRLNGLYFKLYYTGLYLVTHFAIPLAVLIVLNFHTAWKVHVASIERKHLSMNQKSEHRIAIMMIIIIFSFILCRSLPSILNIVEVYKRDLFTNENTRSMAYLLLDISNCLVVLDLASTWVIYYIFNSRYRVHFRWLYCNRPLPISKNNTLVMLAEASSASTRVVRTAFTGQSASAMTMLGGGLRAKPRPVRYLSEPHSWTGDDQSGSGRVHFVYLARELDTKSLYSQKSHESLEFKPKRSVVTFHESVNSCFSNREFEHDNLSPKSKRRMLFIPKDFDPDIDAPVAPNTEGCIFYNRPPKLRYIPNRALV